MPVTLCNTAATARDCTAFAWRDPASLLP
jgi:hypothetical protein